MNMKGGGVGKRKMGRHKRKSSHKQGERQEFERRHLDQVEFRVLQPRRLGFILASLLPS